MHIQRTLQPWIAEGARAFIPFHTHWIPSAGFDRLLTIIVLSADRKRNHLVPSAASAAATRALVGWFYLPACQRRVSSLQVWAVIPGRPRYTEIWHWPIAYVQWCTSCMQHGQCNIIFPKDRYDQSLILHRHILCMYLYCCSHDLLNLWGQHEKQLIQLMHIKYTIVLSPEIEARATEHSCWNRHQQC